ncbi:hypothetical protein GV791_21115 [Nocardia cyriacigeorgica]|uniref:Uncharacterized protein n=1 Tax=Nocardia cyriacigeorgica TaxID=135487 RepID=A0A6P1CTB5_9NOCA|nr:hypothetical protein [Nocardia cyriacigeorgica]NEW35042.1 hypothetical protein [Nocardia cyriacigeorgica]
MKVNVPSTGEGAQVGGGNKASGRTVRRTASLVIGSVAAGAVMVGFSGAAYAAPKPLAVYDSKSDCQAEANRRTAENRERNKESTAPGIYYYCEPWETVQRKTWALFYRY